MDKYTVNEVLCFVSSQFDQLNRENLLSTIIEFYKREELSAAKQLLLTQCEKENLSHLINDYKKNRIGSNVEQRTAKDILDIWEVVDHEKGGSLNTEFVAADPNRLPSVNADKYNLKFLISIILKLQEESELQKSQLETVIDSVASLHIKIPSLDQTSSYASPLAHTPINNSPRRQLPTPVLENERKNRRLNANISSFVPRQKSHLLLPSASSPSAVAAPATTTTSTTVTSTLFSSTAEISTLTAPDTQAKSSVSSASLAPHSSVSLVLPSSVPSSAAKETPPSSASTAPLSPILSAPEAPEAPVISISLTPASASPLPSKGTKGKTFASTTAASPGWNLAQARNKKKIVPITGQVVKTNDGELEGVPPIVRDFWDLSVSRLKETATADKVRSHLHKYGIEVKDVFILSSKIRGTKSAKVRVAREHRERAKSPDIWPQHCRIADWVNFKAKERPVSSGDNGSL